MPDTDSGGAHSAARAALLNESPDMVQGTDPAPSPPDPLETQEDRDSAAVKDTCQYIAKVCQNFNSNLVSYDSETLRHVQEMNHQLKAILLQSEPPGVSTAKPQDQENLVVNGSTQTPVAVEFGRRADMIKKDASTSPLRGERNRRECKPSTYNLGRNSRLSSRRDHVEEVHSLSGRSESSHEHSGSDANSVSSEEQVPVHRRARGRRSRSSSTDVWRAISRLDTRGVPKPAVYDSASGQSFSQFLATFEEYCSHTFRGSRDLWVGELGRFLHGEMLHAFKALQIAGDSYDSVKHKLLQWRRDSKESYEASSKERFTSASPYSRESLRLYAARLEKYFRLAYPNRSIETSSTLRRKFFQSVPSRFQSQLESARSIALTMNDREITWTNILALTSRFDIQHPSNQSKPSHGEFLHSRAFNSGDEWKEKRGPVTNYGEDLGIYQATSHPQQGFSTYRDFITSTSRSKSTPRNSSVPRRSVDSPASRSQSVVRPMPGKMHAGGNAAGNLQCAYCHKDGHENQNCWRRLGRCLVCGSQTHLIADCPERNARRIQQQSRNRSVTFQSPSPPSMQEASGNA